MNNTGQKTALITGASSGVGVEFAKQLADRGFDLVLAARRMERLEQVREEISQSHDVKIVLLGCDLAAENGVEQLVASTAGFEFDIVVNNAGLGIYRPALEHTDQEIDNMIAVNLRSLTFITKAFAEKMVARGSGRILNHASIAGIHPSPWYSVYSGTKSYVVQFSTTLNHELRSTGVTVTTLCPGFFRSEFQQKSGRKPGAMGRKFILEADQVARAGLKGAFRGQSIVIPGIKYKLLNVLIRLFPRSLTMRAADWLVHS